RAHPRPGTGEVDDFGPAPAGAARGASRAAARKGPGTAATGRRAAPEQGAGPVAAAPACRSAGGGPVGPGQTAGRLAAPGRRGHRCSGGGANRRGPRLLAPGGGDQPVGAGVPGQPAGSAAPYGAAGGSPGSLSAAPGPRSVQRLGAAGVGRLLAPAGQESPGPE